MKLIAIANNVLINPEHISQIDCREDYNDAAYVIYTITMYNGLTHELRLHDYYNEVFPWETLGRSFPKLLEGTW